MPLGPPAAKDRTKAACGLDEAEPRKVLVIGGTLFIGRLLVTELLAAGHQVSVLHRKALHPFGRRVQNLLADRNSVSSVKDALGNHRFDAVFDLVYDWEQGTTGEHVNATAHQFEGRVARYIFFSSVAAYGDGLNHHEGDPLAPDDHPNAYVRNKAMSERALFRMHQRTGFPVVTIRPPFVYGPGNPFYREAFFWDRIKAGRPIILPSDGHRLMQFIHVKDLVDLSMRAMYQRNAVGHAFNAANPRPITQHELIQELGRAAGVEHPETVSLPRDLVQKAGGQVMGHERLYFGEYFDVPAITEVITKAQRMLAFRPLDFAVGLRETYKVPPRERSFAKPDFSFEEQLISNLGQRTKVVRTA